MDDRRGVDTRPNGNAFRSLSYGGPQPMADLRQSASEMDSTDLGQYNLTRILGEAWYQYGKMREAEYEKKVADGEYLKQSQYFDNNSKLREVVESRRTRTERILLTTRTEYAKAAQEAEPMLRRLSSDYPSGTSIDEDTIRKIVRAELKDFVMFQDLDKEIDKEVTSLERKIQKRISADVRSMISQELKHYTQLADFEKLTEKVTEMSARGRQMSVSSDTSRDVEQRIVAQTREVENIKSELATRTNQQAKEISILKDRINSMQRDATAQQSRRTQMPPGTKSEDIVKVVGALERAQEVINDQYVTIHDLQLQVATVLEGIRILNEHIEEYDKRLENLQTATEKFFTEVQAENGRQKNIISSVFDNVLDKVFSEIAAKIPAVPASPASAQLASPRLESPRIGVPPNINAPTLVQNTSQLEAQQKSLQELHVRLHKLHSQVVNQQRTVTQIPASVKTFCDDVSRRLQVYHNEQTGLVERINALDFTIQGIGGTVTTHVRNVENNFSETAIHMDSVKKRFGEHRNQLDNLITAYTETVTENNKLASKYEALKKFLSDKILPTIVQIQKASPHLFETATDDTNWTQNTGEINQAQLLPPASAAPRLSGSGGEGGGGGGASNPIEL